MRYLRSSATRRRFRQQYDDVLTFQEVAKWLIDTLCACFRSINDRNDQFLLFPFPRRCFSEAKIKRSKGLTTTRFLSCSCSLYLYSTAGIIMKSVSARVSVYILPAKITGRMWNPAGQSFLQQTSPSTKSTNTQFPSCPESKRSTNDFNTDLTSSSSSSRCLPSSFCCKSDLVLVQVGSWISYLIFFSLALSILITFSSPFIATIYFLRAGVVNFGAFGYKSPGFRSEDVLGYEYGLQVLNPLTNAMILWGIGKPGVE